MNNPSIARPFRAPGNAEPQASRLEFIMKSGGCRPYRTRYSIRTEETLPDLSFKTMFTDQTRRGKMASPSEMLRMTESLLRLSRSCWSPTLQSYRDELAWCARTIRKRIKESAL